MAYDVVRPLKRCPSHPGALLNDIIPETGKGKSEIADLLGISRQQLYDILNEKKPVSANISARLGKLFGNGALLWLNMQSAYDVWQAENSIDLSSIPTLEVA